MIHPSIPMSDDVRARVEREEAIFDAREEREARRKRDRAAARYADVPESAMHTVFEGILAAEAGYLPRPHSDVLARAGAAMDREDAREASGRHRPDCGCDRCVIGKIGATQDRDMPPTRPPWLAADD